jgi:heat shock protein HslJ
VSFVETFNLGTSFLRNSGENKPVKRLFVFALLAIAPSLAASPLEKTWQLEKQSIQFESGKVSGFAGCNNFSGTYKVTGLRLEFSGFATTRKACEKSVMDEESKFLNRLASVKTYSISRDGKRLTMLGDVVLRFTVAK